MNRKLIAFDLDETILPEPTVLPDRTRDVLRAARDAGHVLLVASARHWEMTRWVYDAIGLEGPVCLQNGGLVINPFDASFGKFEISIDKDTVRAILTELFAKGLLSHGYIEYGSYCWVYGPVHNKYYKERVANSISAPFDRDSIPDTPALRLQLYGNVYDDAVKIKEISERYTDIEGTVYPNPKISKCSVCNKNADKWNAVKYVAETMGIAPDDVYTFGDQWNDFRMVAEAAHGYAMLGSPAEKYGRYVTRLSCRDYGVADIIEREILGKTEG